MLLYPPSEMIQVRRSQNETHFDIHMLSYVYSKQLPLHLAPILCADEFDGGRAVALSPRGVEGARRVHGVRTDGDLIGAWDQPRGRKSGETTASRAQSDKLLGCWISLNNIEIHWVQLLVAMYHTISYYIYISRCITFWRIPHWFWLITERWMHLGKSFGTSVPNKSK